MEPNIASPKATGGGGFVFEDMVAAHFMCYLLRHRIPFEPEIGSIERIDFQVRVDGWFLDDLLLTMNSGQVKRRVAISAKSGDYITTGGFSREFVNLVWRQYFSSSPFDRDHDLLVLVTAPGSFKLKQAVSKLLKLARKQDPHLLSERIYKKRFVSKIERSLFSSFSCPEDLIRDRQTGAQDIGAVLRSVRVLFFDYELDPSEQLQSDIQICSETLSNGSIKQAHGLWLRMCSIASKFRPYAGFFDLPRLLGFLRNSFQLKEYPVYEADWEKLFSETQRTLISIPDTIGGRVKLDRELEENNLEQEIEQHRVCAMVGPSGCGKSVIVKRWAGRKKSHHSLVFWDANRLKPEQFSIESIGTIRFNYSLDQIIPATTSELAYFVVDGLDHLSEDGEFANLVEVSTWLRLEDANSPWKLILTCQLEEWDRVQRELVRFGGSVLRPSLLNVDHPDIKQLDAVWNAFPSLQQLSSEKHLHHVLLKPKILDLFAGYIAAGTVPDTRKWVGESDLIAWFWETAVNRGANGPARSFLLQRLGENQADTMLYQTGIYEFTSDDLITFETLRKDRICKIEEEKIAFDHDLFGDWSRQRFLLTHSHQLSEFLPEKLVSPPWHRGIRLFGLHLLEFKKDQRQWLDILNQLAENKSELGKNLLLEAIIFTSNPDAILESLWDVLAEDGGHLLYRFLGQFLQVATLPSSPMLDLPEHENLGIRLGLAVEDRIPILPLWPPVLTFLSNHKTEVIPLAPSRVGRICDMWLRHCPLDSLARTTAADLALTGARTARVFT